MKTSSWVKIGKIGKAHGLRGAFFVVARDGEIPRHYRTLLVGDDLTQGVKAEIISHQSQGGLSLISLNIASDRTAIEALRGRDLWVEASAIKVDESKEYLWDDIIGRNVIDATGNKLGVITNLYNAGASDIAIIKSATGQTLEIPFVGTYVNLAFERGAREIHLVVDADIFAELWEQEPKP